jgi:hypothetical protein
MNRFWAPIQQEKRRYNLSRLLKTHWREIERAVHDAAIGFNAEFLGNSEALITVRLQLSCSTRQLPDTREFELINWEHSFCLDAESERC